MRSSNPRRAIHFAGMLALACGLAHAQQVQTTSATSGESAEAPTSGQPSISSSIAALGEFKKGLLDLGYNFQLNYTGEVLGNSTGGVKQRAIYEDLLELVLEGDLAKIAGHQG